MIRQGWLKTFDFKSKSVFFPTFFIFLVLRDTQKKEGERNGEIFQTERTRY